IPEADREHQGCQAQISPCGGGGRKEKREAAGCRGDGERGWPAAGEGWETTRRHGRGDCADGDNTREWGGNNLVAATSAHRKHAATDCQHSLKNTGFIHLFFFES